MDHQLQSSVQKIRDISNKIYSCCKVNIYALLCDAGVDYDLAEKVMEILSDAHLDISDLIIKDADAALDELRRSAQKCVQKMEKVESMIDDLEWYT